MCAIKFNLGWLLGWSAFALITSRSMDISFDSDSETMSRGSMEPPNVPLRVRRSAHSYGVHDEVSVSLEMLEPWFAPLLPQSWHME